MFIVLFKLGMVVKVWYYILYIIDFFYLFMYIYNKRLDINWDNSK